MPNAATNVNKEQHLFEPVLLQKLTKFLDTRLVFFFFFNFWGVVFCFIINILSSVTLHSYTNRKYSKIRVIRISTYGIQHARGNTPSMVWKDMIKGEGRKGGRVLYKSSEMSNFCLKHDQVLKASAVHLYLNISLVPPPPLRHFPRLELKYGDYATWGCHALSVTFINPVICIIRQ